MKILDLAGIDTSIFRGYGSRSTASSGAELAGTSISNI